MNDQILVILIILATLYLFVDGRIRYDFVALMALVALVLTGVIDGKDAFKGFGHPAVITVAAVLIISSALIKTGAIEKLVALLGRGSDSIRLKVFSLMSITALLSAFMNNVGALAIIMPICMTLAKDKDIPPSKLLMPVAFASLLGGMITGIGTPPNLIISTFRVQAGSEPFSFLAFTPVGLTVTIAGILFTSLIGWKLIPVRGSSKLEDRFNLDNYLFELIVTEECPGEGIRLRDFQGLYGESVNVVSIMRQGDQILSPGASQKIFPDDLLIVKSSSESLNNLTRKSCLQLKSPKSQKLISENNLRSNDISLVEVVLRDDSPLIGRTAVETQLRTRYNANLIAVSRRGIVNIERLKSLKFNRGDILLLQVAASSLDDIYGKIRCLPLAKRETGLKIMDSSWEQKVTVLIFGISVILAVLELVPVQISFTLASLALVMFRIISPREFYQAIEWPTIIMIGSLFALGEALETSGGSESLANIISGTSSYLSPGLLLALIMTITVILTNIVNNNAATILMAPIALRVAALLGVSHDPFLMAVCVGASISYITPIGHQSNTLIMGPGGYKFSDYWRLGLPLSILSIAVGTPLILMVWPL
ncbi:MAG TPA: SLC13 family permease [Clostridiaceae bacterium]|nr:SLC13 family permease [Clostridiaceae bacterium]